jgi:membrane-bound lytic murein transglycosylase D
MLTIPVSANYTPSRSYSSSSSSSTRSVPQNIEGHVKLSYLVKSGDTLGEIAEIYGTRASNIRYWNGLRYGQYIYPGNRLNIWVPEGSAFASVASNNQSVETSSASSGTEEGDYQIYVVRSGDTLWDIARRHGVELQELRSWNMDVASGDIKPGDRIRIAVN